MARKTFYWTDEVEFSLKDLKESSKLSESEIVRDLILGKSLVFNNALVDSSLIYKKEDKINELTKDNAVLCEKSKCALNTLISTFDNFSNSVAENRCDPDALKKLCVVMKSFVLESKSSLLKM